MQINLSAVFTSIAILLVVFGFALCVRLIYRRYWDEGLSFNLLFSRKEVFEGETFTITDVLTNRKYLPIPWIHVSYTISRFMVYLSNASNKISRGDWRTMLCTVGMYKTVSRKSAVLASKRGYYHISDIKIMSNDPLMTSSVEKNPDERYALTVYPRQVEFPESMIPFKKMLGDITARRFTNPDPFTFRGIREYEPHDSFKQINWGATARAGTLMSNVYDFTVSQEVTIFLNLQRYSDYERDYVHEEAIRLVAFLCRKYAQNGVPVSLVCPAGDGSVLTVDSGLSSSHLMTIYTALAHINLVKHNLSLLSHLPKERGQSIVLVSSYHESELHEKFLSTLDSGVFATWIVPHCERDFVKIGGEEIIKWEVPRDAVK
ncbi:MAG: DUF58 domain-containing protein [Oscillospiraceae bacterium]|nr:DUF58 domain-containing protein [Oscillospiraceae bacterium]MCL2278990.1 DUF58 domain-containing protein [Oscillospiraceae bacterium]